MDTGLAPEGQLPDDRDWQDGPGGVAALAVTGTAAVMTGVRIPWPHLSRAQDASSSTLANCVRFFIFGSCGRHYYTSDR